ncbi:retron system putative HNH endonuclease [Desulfobotulus mexicanus]|uniref:TIGR02646 family protein n=1 Tax=Desulfobotulus mexicanus TaxID=2586642 RepID=A0A5Q4VFD3_9BACT|nr:retron system putative HNH endonuclease [Desulfobotulus mexicanus]TYT75596.1 TIGR02646 family protein [Desulfobotulus mexicanus]
MKFIKKQKEPAGFSDWKALANENWQPTYKNLSGEPKKKLKIALMAEQGYICCYCERRLKDKDSHIEHFMPQSNPAVDPLDYGNLLCSCQVQIKEGEPRHCGNLKDNWYDPDLLISPLDPDCESRFVFTGDGSIMPADDKDMAAFKTIEKLGLSIGKLNALRAAAIEPFLDDQIPSEEFEKFISDYLFKDQSGQFAEFWTSINYLFGGFFQHE